MSTIIIANGKHVNDAVKAMETASLNFTDTQLSQGAALLQSCADQINQFTASTGVGPYHKS